MLKYYIIMLIENKKITNLKVETESGQEIGKVSSFEVETDSQSIINYKVSPSNLLKELISVGQDIIVNRGQIVDIKADKIIVDDNVVANKKQATNKLASKKTATLPAMKIVTKK